MKSPLSTMAHRWDPDISEVPQTAVADGIPRRSSRDFGESLRVDDAVGIKATIRILKLDHGLYALNIAAADESLLDESGIALPAVQILNPPSDRVGTAEIVTTSGDSASWLGPEGGTVVIKAPLGGGQVLIAIYEPVERPGLAPEVEIRRLDRPAPDRSVTSIGEAANAPPGREIQIEIRLHIERTGDLRLPAQGWVGARGKKLRIEAFSILPLEALAARDIEYKAFGPNARETPWVSGGNLCGTRGRHLPLTGFAIRLAPQLQDRFKIEYQGAFFESGISNASRNGEPCTAPITDDPLEAINLRLIELFGK
jgi:hypothetical protein